MKKARKPDLKPDVPLQTLFDPEAERQARLDAMETEDAVTMLVQLGANPADGARNIAIAKRWLKKHWSDGWRAASGPSGAPEIEAKARKAKP
jgi:hypothetical protein